jgi:hypothetical protein
MRSKEYIPQRHFITPFDDWKTVKYMRIIRSQGQVIADNAFVQLRCARRDMTLSYFAHSGLPILNSRRSSYTNLPG